MLTGSDARETYPPGDCSLVLMVSIGYMLTSTHTPAMAPLIRLVCSVQWVVDGSGWGGGEGGEEKEKTEKGVSRTEGVAGVGVAGGSDDVGTGVWYQ
jgi:hypothetical protein